MEKIRVDFNRMNGEGEIVSSANRASGRIEVGDVVLAYQPGEPDMDSEVVVTSLSDDNRVTLAFVFQPKPSGAPFWFVRQEFYGSASSQPIGSRVSTLLPISEPAREPALV